MNVVTTWTAARPPRTASTDVAGFNAARLFLLALGATMVLGGLAGVSVGGPSAAAGAWGVIVGLIMIVGALIERVRYRSDVADRAALPPGPGGGEPSADVLEPRFRRTDELFEDPTTRRRIRVWLDPGSGERRYVAED